jgi:23S rRNA (uridine2552-2'-O)-methyltransferase
MPTRSCSGHGRRAGVPRRCPGAWSPCARREVGLSGMDVSEAPRSTYLAQLALDRAAPVLKGGGSALIKVFQGAGFEEFVRAARVRFGKVKLMKPEALRSRSPEMYLLAMQFGLV